MKGISMLPDLVRATYLFLRIAGRPCDGGRMDIATAWKVARIVHIAGLPAETADSNSRRPS